MNAIEEIPMSGTLTMPKAVSGTPYDDVFRTLVTKCSRLVILFINEVFGEFHSLDEKLVCGANEHFENRQDGKQEERITDSCFWFRDHPEKRYHIECQSTPDHTIVIRMYEYDMQIALENRSLEGNVLTVRFPESSVLFLRDNGRIPDQMTVRVVTPGGEVSYEIPAVKIKSYPLDQIFKKRLLLLIPFYIFRYEQDFPKMEDGKTDMDMMLDDFRRIRDYLTGEDEAGRITALERSILEEMTQKVVESIAHKHASVQKGVKDVMGGKVLELESTRIYDEGQAQGRSEGEDRLGRLVNRLIGDGRLDDVWKCTTDKAFRQKLFSEYGL